MKKFYLTSARLVKGIFCALTSLATCMLPINSVKAEGSKELAARGGYRAFMNSTSVAGSVNIFPTLGVMRVYVNAGERLFLGSSAQGIGNGVIRVRTANGQLFTSTVGSSTGRISNRTQEVNGPNGVSGMTTGYTPYILSITAAQAGVCEIEFIPPNVNSTTSPSAILASSNWTQPSTTFITAFDITVVNASNTAIPGRVYTNIFTANMGNYQYGFNGLFYVLTNDGYLYTVDNNGQTGFGFSFFANNKGARTTSGDPLYKSVDVLANANVHDPRSRDTETDVTHKLFFNTPSADLPQTSTSYRGSEWLRATPPALSVSGVTFRSQENTSSNSTGTYPLGGVFTFTAGVDGNFAIDLDLNNNGVYTETVDRRLTGTAIAGVNTVYWNGRRNDSTSYPATTTAASISNRVQLFGGEVHFPFIDVENNVNGIIITRVGGTNLVNWDDTPITVQGTPSNPRKTTDPGLASTTNGHRWGSTAYGSADFGDEVLLDTWAYVQSAPSTTTVSLNLLQSDLEVTGISIPQTAYCVGQSVSFTVTARNNGPSAVTGADMRINYPAEMTGVSVTPGTPTGTVTVSNVTNGTTQYTSDLAMSNGGTITFTVTGTVSAAPAGGVLAVSASIMRPADVTDPDATDPNATEPGDPQVECDAAPSGAGCNNIKAGSVTINAVPTTAAAGPNQTLCAATTATLAGNTPAVGTGTWTKVSGPGTQVITAPNTPGTTVTGLTTGTYVFRWTITNGACTASTSDVTIVVQPGIAGNTVTAPATSTFCGSGDPAVITGSTPTGGSGAYTYQWTSSTDNVTFTPVSGATSASYDPPVVTATTYFQRTVTSGSCSTPVTSNVVTITVQPGITNNTITAPATTVFCEIGNAAVITGSTPTGGSGTYAYQWQSSPDNSTWTNIAGATAATYDPVQVGTTQYYRRTVVTGACATPSISNVVTITVNPAVTAGSVSSSQTFCTSGNPATFTETAAPTGGGGTYTYQWQSSVTGAATGFTDIAGATAATYDAPVLTQNTWYRRIARSAGCTDAISNVLSITIWPTLTAGTVGTSQSFCGSGDPALLTPSAAPTGGSGVYAFQWQISTTSATAGFTDIAGATAESYDPPAVSQSTWYRRVVRSDNCTDAFSNAVAITVTAGLDNNIISANQSICTGTAPATLTGSVPTGGTGAYTYLWESSTTGTGGFAAAPGANTGQSYTPPALTASTIYRRRVTSGICGTSFSNIVQVTVTAAGPAANAGPDQGPLNAQTVTLAANASGSGTGAWSQVSGPNTANIVSVGQPGTDVGNLVPGTYVFRWTITNPPCAATFDDVTIIINAPPVAGNDAATTPEDVAVVIAILPNDSDPDGTIASGELVSPPANGTIVLNADNTVTYTPRANFFGTDAFTYILRDNLGTVSNTATVSITVTAVNDVPVAGNDNINVEEDTRLNLPAPGILDNDTDADGGQLAASLVSGPDNGTLTLNSDGSLSYLPRQDYTGTDQFTYRVCDATGLCDTATVTINVGNLNDAPVGVADAYTIAEDGILTIAGPGVLANDTDADGDPLTANLLTPPANGTLQLQANGSFRYVPAPDYNGPDSFTYNACDASGACSSATVTLTVTAVNDKPLAGDDAFSLAEDEPLTVTTNGLLFNDTDPDNNTLTASVVTPPANGTLALNPNGTFTYTPTANFNGIDNFTYRICDNGVPSLCDTASVQLTVAPRNDVPVAVNDTYTTAEDVSLSVNAPGVLANDTDIEGDALTVTAVTLPAHGRLTLNSNGSFVYVPDPNYNGADAFTYRVCDAGGGCDTGTVAITVTAVNDRPVASDATFNLQEDATLNVAAPGILINDRDPDGDALTVTLLGQAASGTVTLNPNGSFSYTPNLNFNGTDRFTYRVCDNGTPQLCDTGTVILNVGAVNDKPVGVDDSYTVAEDNVLTIAAPGVLANDSDPDGDALTVAIQANPAHGTLALNANGSFTYRPATNYNGTDNFTYRLCDAGGDCDTVSVSISVTPVNDAPVAADDVFNGQEDQVLNITAGSGLLFNDSDPEGDALTASVVTLPASGTLTVNANGSFSYTPVANFNGVTSFTYRVCDGGGLCDTATVQLRIANVNDAPVPGTDSYTVPEDGNLTIAPPGLLANDTDADGDELTASLQTQPQHGTIVINNNGGFVYTPDPDYNGPDSFTYLACDKTGVCVPGTVNLTVTATNDRPQAKDDFYTLLEDVPLAVASNSLLFNDADIDGDALTASLVTPPAAGTVVLNPNGTFTYTPNANFNGRDSLLYRVCDPQGACDTAVAIFVVEPAPDAPAGADDAYTLNEDTPLTVAATGLLANDVDPDNDPLTASVYAQPANGTVTVNANGSFTYTPNADFNGTDAFVYRVCDNGNPSRCDTATVRLTVNAVADAPVAADDNYSVKEDAVLTIPAPGILQNDREPDGQAMTAVLETGPVHGALTLNPNGSFTYTPAANFSGIDSFTYRSCDPGTLCGPAVVRIVVTPENDVPVAVADDFTLAEDATVIVTFNQLLANDSDPDGDALTLSNFTQPANGTIVRTDGPGGVPALAYTPRADFNGTDQFTYTVCDPGGACATTTVTFTVTPVNDPVIANDDGVRTPQGTPVTITYAQLLANDIDVEGETLTVTLVSPPAGGTFTPLPNGWTFTPAGTDTSTRTFVYSVCEPAGGTCDTATVFIRVNNINDAPEATADSYTVAEDEVLAVSAPGVLGNDTDVDDIVLSAAVLINPANGTLVLRADGSFTYTPNANFFGTDQFTYNVCDAGGLCDNAVVTITVTSVNDDPVAADDESNVNEDTPATGNVLTNDTDPDTGSTLTASLITGPSHGALVVNTDGSYTYTPSANFNGTDLAVYRVCNNGTPEKCDTATLTFNVAAQNDTPVPGSDLYTVNEDTELMIATNSGVLGNDTDADGDELSAILVAGARHGTVTFQSDGSFRYLPNENYNGLDTFTYRVCDVFGACQDMDVYIRINPVNDKPVAGDDFISTTEEAVVVLDPASPVQILVNDRDPDGDPLTATPIGSLEHGTLTANPDGTYTYTSDANYTGFDYIYYQVCDNGTPALCDTAFVTIQILNATDAPVARRDSFTVSEDMILDVPLAQGVLSNDTDDDGEAIVASVVTNTQQGRLTLNLDGSFRYQPNLNFNGVDSFTYRACDAAGLCSTSVARIIVVPVNDPPVGVDDAFSRAEDTTITFTGEVALINDTDPDGDVLSGRPIGSLTKGTFTSNPDGSYTYTPAPNFNGVDSIEYQVCDPSGLCDTAIIRLTILPRNDAPVVHPLTYALKEDVMLEIPVPGLLSNSSDVDGDNMSVSLKTPPAHGRVEVRPDGSFRYTPSPGYNGRDTLQFLVCDPAGACDSGYVYLDIEPVNDAPVANSDNYTAAEDTPLSIPAAGVLANDADPDGDALTAVIVTQPTVGTVVLQPDGSFLYTPAPDYSGPDEFVYRVCDALLCDEATVRIDVVAAKDIPVAVNDTLTVIEDEVLTFVTGVLRNDRNPDQGVLNVTVVTPPQKGEMTLGGNGALTYRPGLNQFGRDSAVYRICNIDNDCNEAKIYFEITPVNDPPVGVDDNFIRTEDTVLTFPPAVALINDTDPDGDVLTGQPIGQLTKGSFVRNPDGTYTYTPLKDFHGVDSIEYEVCDPSGLCDTAIIRITLLPVNDKPVAVNDTYSLQEDEAFSLAAPGFMSNDSDVDGDALNFSLLDGPWHGSLTVSGNGSVTYLPASNYTGGDTLRYIITDAGGLTDTAFVYLEVTGVNDKPVALDNAYSLDERTTATGNVMTDDSDPDGNNLTASVVLPPVNGTLTLNPDGSFTYVPNGGFQGLDSAWYRICDDGVPSLCDTARISFFVNNVNDAPVAAVDSVDVTEDVPATGNVLTNDSDPEGNTLTASLVTAPVNGTVVLNADGSFTYTPNANYNGQDSLFYQVCDNGVPSLCDTAVVRFNVQVVNDAPVAEVDSVDVTEDVPATGNVLTNDSDPEGNTLTASLVTAPVNGTVVLNADGAFTYTPNAGYNGLDSLVYQVCDNGTPSLCDTAIVRFTIAAVNDAPIAVDDAANATENQPATGNVLTNDTDPEGNGLTASLVTAPVNGTVVLNADGSFTYTPNAGYNGLDSLVYQVCDNGTPSLCDTGVLRFTIAAVNDAPVAVDDATNVLENQPATGNVLTNDTDPEGNGLTASLVTAPVNGTVVLNADGSFTYTPNAGYNGLDSLVYQVCDNGTPSLCDTGVLRFTIAAVNDAPVAVDDTTNVTENQPATGNVLTNDTDPEGNGLTASLVTAPVNGTVVLNADGSFTYTPNAGYNGLDSLVYQVCDNGTPSLCDTGVLRFTIAAVNDAPVAVDDATNVLENQPATGNVLTNDTDPEGDGLTASLVTAPVNGTVVLNADGSFTYTPNAGYNGLDSLVYQVCDNGTPSLCDTGVLRFTITAVNDAPVAVDDATNVTENQPTTGNVLTNDTDPEGNGLTASLVTAPVNGTVVLNADGAFTYTPNADYNGLDSLVYQVCDNGTPSLCDSAIVRFTIAAVNDAPVAVDDATNVLENQPATGNVLTNDTDPEGDGLTASLVTAPVNGTVVLNADGSFTYTPNAGYNGLDSLVYQVCDNGTPSLCDTAIVRFTIAAVNDAPVAVDDATNVLENQPATGNVLTNDTDPEGNGLTASLVTAPVNGTVVLNADGAFTYTPNADYNGLDSLVYQVCDNGTPSLCDTGVLRFTIAAVNDAPVAVDDATNVTENQPATGNVLTNDTDPEGNGLTASLVTAPVNGTVVLNADGSFTYTPNAGYNGLDSLVYQVCDNGTPSLCDTAIVRFTIAAVNDAPVAVDDATNVLENQPATGNVLTNDTDPEGNGLTASLVTAPVYGTVVLNADGSFTYTPNAGYNGLDSLVYQVCDNGTPSLCDTGVLRFTIAAVNDAPVAVDDATNVLENQPATGNVLTNDTDPEGNGLTAGLVMATVNGTVVLNADGSFTYTPNAGYNGLDSLVYQVCDNGTPSLCDTGVLRFTIAAVNDAPVAIDDTTNVTENQPATGNVLTNDTDPEGNGLTASLVTAPVNGTVVLNADGSFTYTPNAGYNGLDSLVYQVCDNGTPSLCDTGVLRFTIAAVNDAPVAVDDATNVTENQPATGNVLTNDTDPEGNGLTASLVTAPVNGTVVLNADGSFTYTPNAGYNGLDSLVYQVCDNGTPSLCDTAIVRFTIAAVNDAPVAIDDTTNVTENQPATGNVLTNDIDPEGDGLTASLVTAPVNGTVVLNADGSFTYTPNAGYNGLDSLVYQVCDNGTPSLCDTGVLRFTIAAVNDAPVAIDDTTNVTENQPATGNVLTNDTDPEGNGLTASLVTAPVNGTVVLNADGSFTYTPNAGYNGLDSLVYQVCDNGTPSLCDTAIVRFTIAAVNDAPVAVDDAANVTENQPTTGNVLTNDTDPEGNGLTASLVTAPVNGTVVLNADGAFTYTPNAGYNGLDSLVYQVCDNGTPSLCDTAIVRFTIAAVNDAPVAIDDTANVTENQPATGNVLTNDTDPEGNGLTASLVTAPVNGTVVLNADGSFTYTPNAGYNGLDSLVYQVCDNGTPSLCDTAIVRFTIAAVNDAPVAVDDAANVTENQPTTGNVLTNDTDPEGNGLTASLVTAPVNGTVVLNADGSFTYTPNAGYNGLDSLVYQVCDNGMPSLCDTGVLRFTIAAVNDAPFAVDDATNVLENQPATGNVLTNDTDPEGDGLTASLVTAPVNGTVVLNADGSFTYTPNAGYNGLDSLVYQVCDNGTPSLCDTGVLRFTIAAVNDAPVAVDDAANILEDQPATGNVLTNDTDPEGNGLTASLVTAPVNGTVVLNADGAFTYTPNAGYNGLDSLVYQVCDNGTPSLCDTAIVRFTIAAVNDAPVAVDDTTNVTENQPATGNVLTNDTDPEGNGLTASLVTVPVNGTVVLNADGSFTYTPNAGYNGLDSLVYQVCDNGTPSLCDTGVLRFTIAAVNDAPIAIDDATNVLENQPATGNVLTNDTDPEGNGLTASLVTAPVNGTVVLNADGSFTYTPNAGYNGLDSLVYQVCDNGTPSLCDTGVLRFTIAAVNDAPVAVDDTANVTENQPATGNVLTNDTDPEGNGLTASLVTAPVNGTVVLNADGSFTYTPNAGYNGLDSLVYQVCDNGTPSLCDTGVLRFTIAAVNDAPVAVDDATNVLENQPATGNVLTNDTDPEGNGLTASLVTAPVNGTVVLNADGSFTYTPNAGYNGLDSLVYQVCDNGTPSLCDTAIVRFTITAVNDAPVAVDDATNVTENQPTTGNVLTNDTDPEGNGLTASLVTAPVNGTVVLNVDGSFTYTPNAGYNGLDSLVYQVCDSGTPSLCDTAIVRFTITAVNDAPVALNDSITVNAGQTGNANVAGNDTDPDNNTLTASIINGPANGQATITTAGIITYSPLAGFSGRDTVTYRICDNGTPSLCDTALLIIIVEPPAEAPAAALAKAAEAAEIQPDGSYRMQFTFYMLNTGNTDLKDVMITDDLRNTFPAPTTWTVESITATGTLVANPQFNGSTDVNLLQILSTLDSGARDSVMLTIRVQTNGQFGPFSNQASWQAKNMSDNRPVNGNSKPGRNPNASVSGPTVFEFAPRSAIGLAKAASDPKLEIDGSYTVVYTLLIRNMGNTNLNNIRLTDDLARVFPSPQSFRIVGNISASGALTPNQDFNGTTDPSLLEAGNSAIAANRQDTVRFTVNITPNKSFGTFNNAAEVRATVIVSGNEIMDVSTNGNLADPDGNGRPDESAATPVVLSPTSLRIPGGFSPNGDGVNDRFVIGNVGSDKIHLEVYNRWGNVVYKSPEYKNDWNGTCNLGLHIGENLPDGTYYYIVVNLTTGEKYVNFITLIR